MDIRRFFAPKPGQGGDGSSTDAESKNKKKLASKTTSSRSEEKRSAKRKKRVIADSDEEEEEKKTKKSPGEKPSVSGRKNPVTYVSDSDSDETFLSLKKPSKLKENSRSKDTKSSNSKEAKPKQVQTPPLKSPSPKKETKKSPLSPTPPKPSAPKHTPTSVLDFFGSSTAKRSDKKLVASASTKRKAPAQDPEETHNDAAIAKQLQMEDDFELEKQIHEDEEFARTLAMCDEAPQPKKARVDSHSPSKISSRVNVTETKQPSPKKSSKLALMKKRAEEEEERQKSEKKEKKPKLVSPKKEPIGQAVSEMAATPKTAVSTPKSGGGSTKSSPTKPEVSPEDSEKKRVNSAAYRNYLNREGPRALGSKEIPQGEDNCLEGCVFVLTGVLESMERDETKSLIERYGGKVTGNVSRKTTYLVLGRDSGVSKTEKIKATKSKTPDSKGRHTPTSRKDTPKKRSASKSSPSSAKLKSLTPGTSRALCQGSSSDVRKTLEFSAEKSKASVTDDDGSSLLWVDKYRPRSLKNLIGQQGEQSCANKLLRWLKNWHKNHSGNSKPAAARFGKFGGKDDGSGFKAALLSGPPGVGKTTTAALVCEELIGLIKNSKIPIICMCNDRNHMKIRSLSNYCFDLRFQRPRVEQIKGAMMSIAFKEGLKIPPPALNEVILASNQDIRQQSGCNKRFF
ncbi:Replication factor C subunit 1 [Bagarius yarrelli]|uniref:Replication factor C subunit 1 n=1 Tax=Bagarius yarrelli TaxID=175774 RepID=A0A556UGJ2_BAGYA|nr:Replication factor C subunit 1 [Bagarius yarrelli]